MRICVSGPQCTGKTTFIQDFLQEWPKYKTTKKTYREVITDENLDHSSVTTEETQRKILDWMVLEGRNHKPKSKIIFDRGPLDNLVYTMWAAGNNLVSEEFFLKTVERVKNSMKYVDLIIIIPLDKTIQMKDDAMRDTNLQYQRDINDIFMFLYDQYKNNFESNIFFPYNDSPGVITLSGSRDQRIKFLKENYFDETGDIYGDEHSIINPNHHEMMEELIADQQDTLKIEKGIQKADKEFEDKIKKLRSGL